jgi:hypothetical protein
MSAGWKREQKKIKISLPPGHGIVTEGHLVGFVSPVPLRMAVGKNLLHPAVGRHIGVSGFQTISPPDSG